MLKVLIVDDEEKICQLISKLIDWEHLGLKVIAMSSNGGEAIQLVEMHQPEIVITDIRMPGINGMQLIARIKELSPNTECIIISGYRHFEYAQSALQYGVRNYLLKPVKKSELTDTLKRIVENYREKYEQLNFEERVRLVMKNDAERLRSDFLSQIIYGMLDSSLLRNVETVNQQYHFSFRKGVFQVLEIKADHMDYIDSNLNFWADKIGDIVRQHLALYCIDYELYVEGTASYILMNYEEDEQKNSFRSVRQILEELKVTISILKGVTVTIGVGNAIHELKDIRQSLLTAQFMIQQRLILGTGRTIDEGDARKEYLSNFVNSKSFQSFNRNMERALESLEVVKVRKAIGELKEILIQTPKITGHEILQMSKEVCNIYLFSMNSRKIRVENRQTFMESFNKEANECATIEELFAYLTKVVCDSFQKAVEEKRAEDNKPIRLAKEYIQKWYMNQLTLEEISSEVGFTSNYFSTLFKKETGESFLEYLQTVRMEAAKKLLVTTDEGMNSIVEQVGYSDVKYFTKCFIKYTGLKPREYRKIYS